MYTLGALALRAAGIGAAHQAARYTAGAPHTGTLALRAGRMLSGPGLRAVNGAAVLIRDGRILEAGPRVPAPSEAEVVEARGATVLPGLIDMHVHLGMPETEQGEDLGALDMPGFAWEHSRLLPGVRRALLEHGVTTVCSLGDERGAITELRDGAGRTRGCTAAPRPGAR